MRVLNMDCIEGMRMFPPDTFDAIVTDPPYHLTDKPGGSKGFMGKSWDGGDIAFRVEMWREALRVLKPGGHLLAFSGSRTYHRMTCAIEDAGFEIRDQIMWIYGCLDEQTQVATIDGVKPYHKTKIGDLVLCYNPETAEYSYQPILDIVEYEYKDTAYRLIGDFGEQVVSRNHRCIVERDGSEIFQHAETLECQAYIPILEDLPALQQAVYDVHERTGGTQQNLQPRVPGRDNRPSKQRDETASDAQRADSELCCMQQAGLETGCMVAQSENADLQPGMQRAATRPGMENACAQGAEELDGTIRSGFTCPDDGTEQSCLERGADLSQPQRRVCKSTDQICKMPATIHEHGAERRLRDGTSFDCCASDATNFNADRSSASHQSRRDRQPDRESNGVRHECGSQGVRAWGGHKTHLVRVVPFHYEGKVWCLRVPTGAFVAVRNGVAFPTGNSGFPKSLDVSKAIDKAAGAEREIIGQTRTGIVNGQAFESIDEADKWRNITAPATEAARQWAGWGTALKPAHEPICVARKPLIGTVAENVLAHGTGALNIDGCRVDYANDDDVPNATNGRIESEGYGLHKRTENWTANNTGRWPANFIHDGLTEEWARFFYCAKASKRDRDEGLDAMPEQSVNSALNTRNGEGERFDGSPSAVRRNTHPTVKPTELMRYLVRLVTPPGGCVLDPFAGSGSTGKAAVLEGFVFMGFELDPHYCEIANSRIAAVDHNVNNP